MLGCNGESHSQATLYAPQLNKDMNRFAFLRRMLPLVSKLPLRTSQRDLADARDKWILLQMNRSWRPPIPNLLRAAAYKWTWLLPNKELIIATVSLWAKHISTEYILSHKTNQNPQSKINQKPVCTLQQQKRRYLKRPSSHIEENSSLPMRAGHRDSQLQGPNEGWEQRRG